MSGPRGRLGSGAGVGVRDRAVSAAAHSHRTAAGAAGLQGGAMDVRWRREAVEATRSSDMPTFAKTAASPSVPATGPRRPVCESARLVAASDSAGDAGLVARPGEVDGDRSTGRAEVTSHHVEEGGLVGTESFEERVPVALPVEVAAALPDPDVLVAAVEMVADPLDRARVATDVLRELEEVRLVVVRLRCDAAVRSALGTRALARALGVSVGTAGDLRSMGRGLKRRANR